ncbi:MULTISPECIES: rhodanese-like domain-containing protein [Flavobacteriaceae]|nr:MULTISPECIES: rhodanese-like domain-containing protein [Flavobacteriaceae]
MKTLLTIFAVTLFALTTAAQKPVDNPEYQKMLDTLLTHSVNEISPNEVQPNKDVIFLDTRAKKEFKVSRIDGAIWVGFLSFNKRRVKEIPKDKKIILYCSVGYRSEKIAEKLQEEGFTDIHNLYGGIFEWLNKGKIVVNDKGPTQEIHPYNKHWGQWLDKGVKAY